MKLIDVNNYHNVQSLWDKGIKHENEISNQLTITKLVIMKFTSIGGCNG